MCTDEPEIAPRQPGMDDVDDTDDSALGITPDGSTASLTSSILRYRTIHGRTYHAERGNAEYWASNDEQQNESMDIVHHYLTLAFDHRLYLAPLKNNIQAALDVGTGTGIWAVDFADEFPQCEVTGTDLSPIQPTWVTPNLKFEIEDCTQTWTFEDGAFDYVHMRYLTGSVVDWPALFREAYRVCKPGGWVESSEVTPYMESDDGTVQPETAMHQWGPVFIEGAKLMGRSFTIANDGVQESSMQEVGFTDIQIEQKKLPIGGWPRDKKQLEIGQFVQAALEQDYEGYVQYMADKLGWKKEEVTLYCMKLRREIRSRKHHAFYRVKVVYGQKPMA